MRYLIYLFFLALAGCAGPPSPSAKLEHTEMFVDSKHKNGVQMLHDTQDGVTFVGWPADSMLKICLAPDPDALAGVGRNVSLGIAAPSAASAAASTTGTPTTAPGATAAGGSSFNVANLGGRTQMVLIQGDLLYRACELSNNFHLTKEEALKVYATIIDKVLDMAKILGSNSGSQQTGSSNFQSSSGSNSSFSNNTSFNMTSPTGGTSSGANSSGGSNGGLNNSSSQSLQPPGP